MDVELEWAYEPARAALPYDGRIEAYDGRLAQLQPLREDKATKVTATKCLALAGRAAERKTPGSAVPVALYRRVTLASDMALSCPA